MPAKLRRVVVDWFGKSKVFLADDVEEIAVGPNAVGINLGDGTIVTYMGCPVELTHEEIPEIIEASKIVGVS